MIHLQLIPPRTRNFQFPYSFFKYFLKFSKSNNNNTITISGAELFFSRHKKNTPLPTTLPQHKPPLLIHNTRRWDQWPREFHWKDWIPEFISIVIFALFFYFLLIFVSSMGGDPSI